MKLMIERAEHADSMDPQLDADAIREATGLVDDDIEDAADELEGQGYVQKHIFIGSGSIGFPFLTPEGELFAKFDPLTKPWGPPQDQGCSTLIRSPCMPGCDRG